jgi:hypothetical protein
MRCEHTDVYRAERNSTIQNLELKLQPRDFCRLMIALMSMPLNEIPMSQNLANVALGWSKYVDYSTTQYSACKVFTCLDYLPYKINPWVSSGFYEYTSGSVMSTVRVYEIWEVSLRYSRDIPHQNLHIDVQRLPLVGLYPCCLVTRFLGVWGTR